MLISQTLMSNEADVADMSAGIYVVQLTSRNGQRLLQSKLVIAR